PGPWRAARDLLLRRPPRLIGRERLDTVYAGEFAEKLSRIAGLLDSSVLPVQGPPGPGETTNRARAIETLVTTRSLLICVCALSHNVIRHLLRKLKTEASIPIRCMHKSDGKDEESDEIVIAKNNSAPLKALAGHTVDVVGGTSFL